MSANQSLFSGLIFPSSSFLTLKSTKSLSSTLAPLWGRDSCFFLLKSFLLYMRSKFEIFPKFNLWSFSRIEQLNQVPDGEVGCTNPGDFITTVRLQSLNKVRSDSVWEVFNSISVIKFSVFLTRPFTLLLSTLWIMRQNLDARTSWKLSQISLDLKELYSTRQWP